MYFRERHFWVGSAPFRILKRFPENPSLMISADNVGVEVRVVSRDDKTAEGLRVKLDATESTEARLVPYEAELKGSIGEGPNHSNRSNHSNSFKIGIFRKFSFENSKISENFNIF